MIGFGSKFFGGIDLSSSGLPAGAVAAQNGLSLDPASTPVHPIVVLGDNGSNASILLNPRFIPMNGNPLIFSGVGQLSAFPGIAMQEGSARVASISPYMSFQSFLGAELGRVNFDDNGGSYFGGFAGSLITTGLRNTAIGYQSLSSNIGANSNTAIGYQALRVHTTNGQNTAVGTFCMESDISGTQNTAVGFEALNASVSTSKNTALGTNAGFSDIDGTDNTYLGAFAGEGIFHGQRNISIGSGAAFFIGSLAITNNDNCIIGYNILSGASGGSSNIVIGNLNNASTLMGSGNIILGPNNNVGATGINVFTNNTVIGTGFSITGIVTNLVFLGNPTQNTIIGAPLVGAVDAGFKLQVNGNFATVNPISGAIDVAWQFGKLTTAAVVVDTTKYLNISVGGVNYKLITGV